MKRTEITLMIKTLSLKLVLKPSFERIAGYKDMHAYTDICMMIAVQIIVES